MIEKALTFGADRGLVGIWTEPTELARGGEVPALIISNSGIIHHCGVWRLHVRLARTLAEQGVPSLRFDLSGIGDSNQPGDALPLDELVRRDFDAAVEYIRDTRGIKRMVALGLCSGARDSLETAKRHPEVVGVVAIDLIARIQTWHHYANHFGKRLFQLKSWKGTLTGKNRRIEKLGRALSGKPRREFAENSGPVLGGRGPLTHDELERAASSLLERGNEFLFLYSNGVEDNYNHLSQFAEALPQIAASPNVAVEFFPEADHTFREAAQQRALIKRIVQWVGERFPAKREIFGSVASDPSCLSALPLP